MEVSKTLQDNIRNVQNQLKLAIQNHQVILLKHQSNPVSNNVKVELWEIQKHIISLGEAQKRLVQQLRKELEANSTNCTLGRTAVLSRQGPSPSPPQEPPDSGQPTPDSGQPTPDSGQLTPDSGQPTPDSRRPTPDRVSTSSPEHCVESPSEQKCVAQVVVNCLAGKQAASPPPASSPKRNDHLHVDATTTKLDFMSSLGLVTQEVVAELRNRRVERKRRSTANHVHFVYGNSWDVCKRKKGNYLLTNSGVKLPAEPSHGVGVTEEKSCPALRIAGLPDSLTIQRITSSEPLCVVCRKTDNVQACSKCSSSYHSGCISDGNCPRCYKSGSSSPAATSLPTISEKMKEKLELLMKSNALCVEKSSLEQRKAQLASALQEQDAARSELLKQQEEATVSIQRVHSFVQSFRTPTC